ncbi:hypothetical protein MMC14_004823 [Varicellaria rhodocarpa]|nr:hypothetical protein [Varicellaria rhodocarpa]
MKFPVQEVPALQPRIDLPTAALNFEEFSFRGEKSNVQMRNVSKIQHKALQLYLNQQYNAIDFPYSEPFFVIGCEGGAPAKDKRPFSIAGMISIWIHTEPMHMLGVVVGDRGQIDIRATFPPELLKHLRPRHVPGKDALLYLADNFFKDSIAITRLLNSLIVELPLVERSEYVARLEKLSYTIEGCHCSISYYNGQLLNTAHYRTTQPDPKHLNIKKYETDYVKEVSAFYPGTTMLSSANEEGKSLLFSSTSAEILVGKMSQPTTNILLPTTPEKTTSRKTPPRNSYPPAPNEAQRIFKLI